MKIGIAGCGITGTAAACFLAAAGHEVTIFEQAVQCQPVGAGILLQPSGQIILRRMGLLEQVESQSAKLDGLEARLASGRKLVRLKYDKLGKENYALGVHRGLLFEALLKECRNRGVKVQTNSPVTNIREDGSQTRFVINENDVSDPFDFVIAADGSKSRLRQCSEIPHSVREYRYAALWMTGPHSVIQDRLYQVIDGTERLVGLLPIGRGEASFFWGLRADKYKTLTTGSIESWKKEVESICPQSRDLLSTIESFDSLIFATYRHVKMKKWFTNRLIFLGDSAHPMSPHLGQGANLALEDAACFADAVGESNHFLTACENYSRERKAKMRYYQNLTRILTPFFQSGSKTLAIARNCTLPFMPAMPVVGRIMLKTLSGTKQGWFK